MIPASESFPHEEAAPINQALLFYEHARSAERHAVIPAAGLEITWSNGVNYHHLNVPILGAINLQQACSLLQSRLALPIRVRFEHPGVIAALAAGAVLPQNEVLYAERAAAGGGYYAPLARVLLRLLAPMPLFPPPPGLAPTTLVVHVRLLLRASKTLREFASHSLLVPPAGFPSLRSRLVATYNLAGAPVPSSASVCSWDDVAND